MSSAWLASARAVQCVGRGSVGTSTTAMALGYLAAQQGRRVGVIVHDASTRLLAACGLSAPTGEPVQMPLDSADVQHGGELWLTAYDPIDELARLVRAVAPRKKVAKRCIKHVLFPDVARVELVRDLTTVAAMHRWSLSDRFDLVVSDSSTRSATSLFTAAATANSHLDHPLARVASIGSKSSTWARWLSKPVRKMLRKQLAHDVFRDVIDFLETLAGSEQQLIQLCAELDVWLRSPGVHAALTTTARRTDVEQTVATVEQLRKLHVSVATVVVNRLGPAFGDVNPTDAERCAADALQRGDNDAHDTWATLARLAADTGREAEQVRLLEGHISDVRTVRELDANIDSVYALSRFASLLAPS